MNLDGFFAKYDGKLVDYDGSFGGQCVDIVLQYGKDVLGLKRIGAGNAIDRWTNYPMDHFERISNSLIAIPQKGDIIIWGTSLGEAGHIAIAVSGNLFGFESFDQNFPVGSACHFQKHNYRGVLGWLRPKLNTTMNLDVLKGHAFEPMRLKGQKTVSVRVEIPNPEAAAEMGVDLSRTRDVESIEGLLATSANDLYNKLEITTAERNQAIQEREGLREQLKQVGDAISLVDLIRKLVKK